MSTSLFGLYLPATLMGTLLFGLYLFLPGSRAAHGTAHYLLTGSLCVWQLWCCLRLYVHCWLLGCPDGLWAPCTGLGLHRINLLSPIGLGRAPLAGLGVALACDAWGRQNSRPPDVSVVSATQEWSESWLSHCLMLAELIAQRNWHEF